MNSSETYIHALGPDAVAEIISEYDNLYSILIKIPLETWKSKDLKDTLQKTGHKETLNDMLAFYEYCNDAEKVDVVKMWLKLID